MSVSKKNMHQASGPAMKKAPEGAFLLFWRSRRLPHPNPVTSSSLFFVYEDC